MRDVISVLRLLWAFFTSPIGWFLMGLYGVYTVFSWMLFLVK